MFTINNQVTDDRQTCLQTRAGGIQAGCLQQEVGTEIQNLREKTQLRPAVKSCIYNRIEYILIKHFCAFSQFIDIDPVMKCYLVSWATILSLQYNRGAWCISAQ